jgi:hypothetical protein
VRPTERVWRDGALDNTASKKEPVACYNRDETSTSERVVIGSNGYSTPPSVAEEKLETKEDSNEI